MIKNILTLVMMILSLALVNAQRSGPGGNRGAKNGPSKGIKISGKVLDADSNRGLEFATISIFKKEGDVLVGGGVSDLDGKFMVDAKGKNLYASIEYISYESVIVDPIEIEKGKPMISLGEIFLSPQGVELEGVEIRAEKSETQFSLDKKTFNVGKDLANRGGSAEDILDNVPSVTVDIEGTVSLRGSEGVRILVDGKPSSLAGVGNSNGLRSIPANMIEKVEVITNPSARYEAEGMAGIINIVLKKDQGHGFNGVLDVSAGYPNRYGAGANLNYRKGDLNWFFNYGINYRENPGGGDTYQEITIDDDIFILDQNRAQTRTGLSNSFRFGLDYFLNPKEQITGAFVYRVGDEKNFSTILYDDYLNSFDNAGYLSKTTRTDDEKEDELNQEYSLNYRKEFSSREHNLNVRAQYTDRSEVESSNLAETFNLVGDQPSPLLKQYSNNDEGYETILFQADYVHPFSKTHKWETGLRSSLRDVRNDFFVGDIIGTDTIGIPGLVNNFFYNEDIHAGYLIYGNGFGKFSYQLGMRAEYSLIKTELPTAGEEGINENNYLNLFPSGHFNYNMSETNSWQISYSRRVRRPRFWDLNPFFSFTDSRNFFSGNPIVNPEYTDSYEISNIKFWEQFNVTGSLFYRKTSSSIQRIQIAKLDEGTTLRVPLNIGEINDIGFDATLSYSGLSWLRLDGNFSIFKNQLTINQAEVSTAVYNYYRLVREFQGSQENFENTFDFAFSNNDRITYNGRLTARFTFWDSDLQLRGNYRGPRVSAQGTWDPVGSLDLGYSKDFLAKKLTLTLSVRDLFNSRKRRGTTDFENFYQYSEFQWRSRFYNLAASYRINQKKKRGGGRNGGGYEGGGDF